MASSVLPQRVIVRHLSGARANQVQEFPLDRFAEITLGRSETSALKFDADRDDMVSRQHARILPDPANPTQFTIEDLNSSNGTFVNKQRILGVARLKPTDVIQLGQGGPEFTFDLDPRPDELMKATRVAEAPAPKATRMDAATSAVGQAADRVSAPAPAKAGVGRETLVREITAAKKQGQGQMLMLGGGLFALMLVVGGIVWWINSRPDPTVQGQLDQLGQQQQQLAAGQRPSTAQIISDNTGKVVYIEESWKLIHVPTGQQIYIEYVNVGQDPRQPQCVPAFLDMNGRLEPSLTLSSGGQQCNNEAVGSSGSGSGFVVGADGFIITNRHVVAGWYHGYTFQAQAGAVFQQGQQGWQMVGVTQQLPNDWVPINAQQLNRSPAGKVVEGRSDFLDVIFAKNEQRFPAQRAAINERHDVALIKVEVPSALQPVTLKDTYDAATPGQPVTVMGYPGVSPGELAVQENQSFDDRNRRAVLVPDPTATDGMIGRIVRNEQVQGEPQNRTISLMGDYFQLTVNATGPGNSGGPVFDDQGNVIGIYSAGNVGTAGERISFAVPIRYAMQLMGPQAVSR